MKNNSDFKLFWLLGNEMIYHFINTNYFPVSVNKHIDWLSVIKIIYQRVEIILWRTKKSLKEILIIKKRNSDGDAASSTWARLFSLRREWWWKQGLILPIDHCHDHCHDAAYLLPLPIYDYLFLSRWWSPSLYLLFPLIIPQMEVTQLEERHLH